MYQAEGKLDESIKIAEEKDRINLKNSAVKFKQNFSNIFVHIFGKARTLYFHFEIS